MPRVTLPFTADDMRLPVLVGPDAEAIARGGVVAPAVEAMALIDTGSNVSLVSRKILSQIGAASIRAGSSLTVAGILESPFFVVSIGLPPGGGLATREVISARIMVMELKFDIPGIDVLFGLDLLLACRLLVNGPGLEFVLDF